MEFHRPARTGFQVVRVSAILAIIVSTAVILGWLPPLRRPCGWRPLTDETRIGHAVPVQWFHPLRGPAPGIPSLRTNRHRRLSGRPGRPLIPGSPATRWRRSVNPGGSRATS